MNIEDWFKIKRYPHIGIPLTINDYKRVRGYVTNPNSIKKHSFLPFIHKELKQRKYRASTSEKNPSGKRKRATLKPKIRDVFFASHLDSNIFSYYNTILSGAYEEYIREKPFNKCIVAYRKIPITEGSNKNKCNIDYAKSTFAFLKQNKESEMTAMVSDVTSFFDNLSHKILKKQWATILGKHTLPPDHYNVFKALTRIRYIEGNQLYHNYDNTMIVEKGMPMSSIKKVQTREKISQIKYFREKNAIAYCTKKEFLRKNINLIKSKNNKTGIPQGSPISATLANVYMLEFDELLFNKINEIGGYYQRYSDDLIVIYETRYEAEMSEFVLDLIKDLAQLEIHPKKTQTYRFRNIEKGDSCFHVDQLTKKESQNRKLDYLGFSYDGKKVLIKSSGFSKFYRSMKRSLKKSASLAINGKNPDNSIFKSNLYKRFTHRGAKRKLIYKPEKDNPKVYKITKKYYWGNYISYINKANYSMRELNGNDSIKKQGRRFWNHFHLLLQFQVNRVNNK